MYIVTFGHGSATKNKLQSAVYDYLQTLDRLIVEDEKLDQFEKTVLAEIERLHKEEYPRCKSLEPKFWSNNRYSGYEGQPKYNDRKLELYFSSISLLYAYTAF